MLYNLTCCIFYLSVRACVGVKIDTTEAEAAASANANAGEFIDAIADVLSIEYDNKCSFTNMQSACYK